MFIYFVENSDLEPWGDPFREKEKKKPKQQKQQLIKIPLLIYFRNSWNGQILRLHFNPLQSQSMQCAGWLCRCKGIVQPRRRNAPHAGFYWIPPSSPQVLAAEGSGIAEPHHPAWLWIPDGSQLLGHLVTPTATTPFRCQPEGPRKGLDNVLCDDQQECELWRAFSSIKAVIWLLTEERKDRFESW